MTRWWKGVAVFAAWLGIGTAVPAQEGCPSPVGAARMLEPLGYKPEPQPPLVPGPLNPLIAPMGPPPGLDLDANHPSAFQCEHYAPECEPYGSIGGSGVQRNRPGSLPIAFRPAQQAAPAVNSNQFPDAPGATNGPLTPVLDLRNMHPNMDGGVRATLGYFWTDEALEFSGVFQPNASKNLDYSNGPFKIPFTNAPKGFTGPATTTTTLVTTINPDGSETVTPVSKGSGSQDPFRNANLVRISYDTAFGTAEMNYRRNNSGIQGTELILGVRYLYTQENLGILAQGASDSAIYSVHTRNNIVAPQFGGEYTMPCPIPHCEWLWFTGLAKAAAGPNFVERTFSLIRNDGLVGFNDRRIGMEFGQVYELSGFLDFYILERLKLRIGYTATWAVGVSEPAEQVNFNLGSPSSRSLDHSSALWHGPVGELQFLW